MLNAAASLVFAIVAAMLGSSDHPGNVAAIATVLSVVLFGLASASIVARRAIAPVPT